MVNAYALAFGGLMLLGGRVGDLLGRRKVFIAGLLVFSAASLHRAGESSAAGPRHPVPPGTAADRS